MARSDIGNRWPITITYAHGNPAASFVEPPSHTRNGPVINNHASRMSMMVSREVEATSSVAWRSGAGRELEQSAVCAARRCDRIEQQPAHAAGPWPPPVTWLWTKRLCHRCPRASRLDPSVSVPGGMALAAGHGIARVGKRNRGKRVTARTGNISGFSTAADRPTLLVSQRWPLSHCGSQRRAGAARTPRPHQSPDRRTRLPCGIAGGCSVSRHPGRTRFHR